MKNHKAMAMTEPGDLRETMALNLLRVFASGDPIMFGQCQYCDDLSDPDSYRPGGRIHRPTCAWIRARRLLGMPPGQPKHHPL